MRSLPSRRSPGGRCDRSPQGPQVSNSGTGLEVASSFLGRVRSLSLSVTTLTLLAPWLNGAPPLVQELQFPQIISSRRNRGVTSVRTLYLDVQGRLWKRNLAPSPPFWGDLPPPP